MLEAALPTWIVFEEKKRLFGYGSVNLFSYLRIRQQNEVCRYHSAVMVRVDLLSNN